MQAEHCDWFTDYEGAWGSDCGMLWEFTDGGPTENRVKFCMGCGKPVNVLPPDEDEDNAD
jgi:hypothetical protein